MRIRCFHGPSLLDIVHEPGLVLLRLLLLGLLSLSDTHKTTESDHIANKHVHELLLLVNKFVFVEVIVVSEQNEGGFSFA